MSVQLYSLCFQQSYPKNGLKLLTRDAILKVQGQEREARSQEPEDQGAALRRRRLCGDAFRLGVPAQPRRERPVFRLIRTGGTGLGAL